MAERGRALHVPGGGFRRFVAESWAELKKVEWPTQNQLIQGVVVVLIACLIVGIFLWGADLVFKRLVQNVSPLEVSSCFAGTSSTPIRVTRTR